MFFFTQHYSLIGHNFPPFFLFFKFEAIFGCLCCPSLPRTLHFLPKARNRKSLVDVQALPAKVFFYSSLLLCCGLKPHLFTENRGKKHVPILFLFEAVEYVVKVNIYNGDCTFWLPDYSCILAARCSLLFMKQLLMLVFHFGLEGKFTFFFLRACCIHP